MAIRNGITIIATVLLLVVISGCNSREESAQLRWQRTMDQARLQAAQESFEDGQLTYAQRILRECNRCSDPKYPLAGQVQELMGRIEDEQKRYAIAGNQTEDPEEMAY